MIILSILFFVTAILYSSVGFGGGSTYLALLFIWGVPYFIFPLIALACNIVVVSGNCFNYIRAGNLNLKLLIPYLIGSIPLAFIGGSLPIEKKIFEILLFLVLTIAGILLLFNFKSYDDKEESYRKVPIVISILIGGVLGFISGIVGIGGGIFLSPFLNILRWQTAKVISVTASVFILFNSVAGIAGQLTNSISINIQQILTLGLAVAIGGQIGNYLNIKLLSPRVIKLLTAILVCVVGVRFILNNT